MRAANSKFRSQAFKPAAGSVLTFGYDDLGNVAGVSIDVRELRDQKSPAVRGLLVEVTESQYKKEKSFVDADEIPELLKGLDALLEVKANPTQFKNFEVRYMTRGELQLTAFNTSGDNTILAMQSKRVPWCMPSVLDSVLRTCRDFGGSLLPRPRSYKVSVHRDRLRVRVRYRGALRPEGRCFRIARCWS